jgi:hypothetical protein
VSLQPGEQLLWQGRPRGGIWLLPSDALLIPFSLMWGGFAIFWEVSVLSNQHARNTVLFPIWGIPFVLVGLYLIVGRFFVRRWMLRNTRYAVTNRRAVAITPSFRGGHRESAVWLRSYPQIDRRGNSRSGTLFIGSTGLGPRSLLADPGWPMVGSLGGGGVVFFQIENPGRAYDLLSSQLSQAS